jgi:AAA domain
MYLGPDQGSLDFETVISQIEALGTEKHPYRTVVFDSITKLFNTAISEESERLGDKDAFGASKKAPVRQMARLVRWVNRIDMNAIFIAHQKDLWGLNAKGQREVIGETFDGYEKLEYDLHLVLRISKIGAGDGAKRFAHIGKSRLTGFPEGTRFDWSYADFAERYGRDVIESEVKQVVLASPEQIAELAKLLEVVKFPEGTTQKWFTKAGVDTFEEMDADVIEKIITMCKERLTS